MLVLIARVDVVHAVDTVFVAIFCSWRCTLYTWCGVSRVGVVVFSAPPFPRTALREDRPSRRPPFPRTAVPKDRRSQGPPFPGPPFPGPPFLWTAQNFALFFSLSRRKIRSFLPSLEVFPWNFDGVFEGRDPQMCTFGVLGLSCEAPAAPYTACFQSHGPDHLFSLMTHTDARFAWLKKKVHGRL